MVWIARGITSRLLNICVLKIGRVKSVKRIFTKATAPEMSGGHFTKNIQKGVNSMRNYCNEGKLPCPYLDFKRKPKCTKYKCKLAYSKTKSKSLGTITTIEPPSICQTALDSSCAALINTDSRTCPGAGNPAMFAENCCADCPWYINKAN